MGVQEEKTWKKWEVGCGMNGGVGLGKGKWVSVKFN